MSTSLTDLHNAMVAAFAAQFDGRVQTIDLYRVAETAPIKTPAILLEMEEASIGDDAGDERTPLRCRFVAHCLLSFQTQNAEVEVREFAAEALRLVRNNRWDLPADVLHPENIEMLPGEIKPGKAGYEHWYVSWDQQVYLGDSVWAFDGETPTEIWVGWAPENFPNDYEQQDTSA